MVRWSNAYLSCQMLMYCYLHYNKYTALLAGANTYYLIVEELETNLMSLVMFITLNICSTCFSEIHQTQTYAMNTITYHIEINYNTPTNHNRQQSTSHQTAPLHTVKSHKLQKHLSLQNKATDVVNRHYSRKLLKMDILMFETCWANIKCNKHNKWHQVGF